MGAIRAADWQRVKGVLEQALECEPSRRNAILDEACSDDGDLRREVERLLRADARAGDFLETPAAAAAGAEPADSDETGEAQAPSHVGPYRVLRELGRGGMGVVYLAERDEPGLRKAVALKVLRSGQSAAFIVDRFKTERQILAALEHAGIARLYDGGTTSDGLPYFVMEYVAGEDLLSYCDNRGLGIPARLRLFRRVCEAVQYAHQSLVVHRDLKPSNILVTAEGDPKLLDFGIAKILNPLAAGDEGQETTALVRLMTPDYASPEQARGLRVTTASDVYSLGVVLYELLSGHRPYRVKSRSASEIERAILEQDPATPSTAVGRKLARQLRGDLDSVVLKALRKEPGERYATAAELAEDLRRHLEGYPVRAKPRSAADRAAKFVRRNRAGVVAAAVALLGLVAGLVIALQQARVAEAERRRAEARFQDVRRLARSNIYELHDAIGNLPGATPARRLLVARALEYLDRLAREAGGDLALQRELADGYLRLAQVQGGARGANLGDTRAAAESLGKALAIRKRLAARTPADPQDVLGLALVEFDRGLLQRSTGEQVQAEQSLLSVAALLEDLAAERALPESERGRLGHVYQRLAETQVYLGKNEAALASAGRAVAESEAALRAHPTDRYLQSRFALSLQQLAESLALNGQLGEALEHVRRARRLVEGALRENPLDAQQTRSLGFVLSAESRFLHRLGDLPGAMRVQARALELTEEAVRRDPQDRWSQLGVSVSARHMGEHLMAAGDGARAARSYRKAIQIAERALVEDPNSHYARMEVAASEHGLAIALLSRPSRSGTAEACAALRRLQVFWSGLRAEGRLPPGETRSLQGLPALLERCSAVP